MNTSTLKTHHGMQWSPETHLGEWTAWLAGLAFGGTVALAVAFALGMEHADSFSDKPLLTVAGVAILASGTTSVVTGALALMRRHDHSWVVVSATVFGVLVTALALQQVSEGLGWLSG
jgi:small neutral amino acid transporter SnatA (MarC family)